MITSPKTQNSIRSIPIPEFLCNKLQTYISKNYGMRQSDRLFIFSDNAPRRTLARVCKSSGVKQIRLHDIRHSHVSLLIDLGFPAMLIAERIGDTVDMVNTVYGHLYPNRHEEVADKLQELVSN